MIIQLYIDGLATELAWARRYENGTIFTALYLDGSRRQVKLVDRKFLAI